MKRGLYIVNFGYKITDKQKIEDGVLKKILGQIKAFNDYGIKVELFNVSEKNLNYVSKFFCSFFFTKQYLAGNYDHLKDVDFVYIRHFLPINIGCICLLKYLHNMGCKIIYEFPTYPYDEEHTGIKGFFFLFIDRLFRKLLKKYVDYVSTYSSDDVIFGIPTIKIINGIDCSLVPVIKLTEYQTDLNLIAVANFNQWHGYDRLIDGLYEYYKKNLDKKIYLKFVGSGQALSNYKNKVIEYNLEKYVNFYGVLSGQALTDVFDESDIAVCSLGCHRKKIFLSSELKSREYMARGLPMISSTKIDVLDEAFPYIYYIPEDDSPVNMEPIISFYENLVLNEDRVSQIRNIRNFAEKKCDMKIVMQPVLNKLFSSNYY